MENFRSNKVQRLLGWSTETKPTGVACNCIVFATYKPVVASGYLAIAA